MPGPGSLFETRMAFVKSELRVRRPIARSKGAWPPEPDRPERSSSSARPALLWRRHGKEGLSSHAHVTCAGGPGGPVRGGPLWVRFQEGKAIIQLQLTRALG